MHVGLTPEKKLDPELLGVNGANCVAKSERLSGAAARFRNNAAGAESAVNGLL